MAPTSIPTLVPSLQPTGAPTLVPTPLPTFGPTETYLGTIYHASHTVFLNGFTSASEFSSSEDAAFRLSLHQSVPLYWDEDKVNITKKVLVPSTSSRTATLAIHYTAFRVKSRIVRHEDVIAQLQAQFATAFDDSVGAANESFISKYRRNAEAMNAAYRRRLRSSNAVSVDAASTLAADVSINVISVFSRAPTLLPTPMTASPTTPAPTSLTKEAMAAASADILFLAGGLLIFLIAVGYEIRVLKQRRDERIKQEQLKAKGMTLSEIFNDSRALAISGTQEGDGTFDGDRGETQEPRLSTGAALRSKLWLSRTRKGKSKVMPVVEAAEEATNDTADNGGDARKVDSIRKARKTKRRRAKQVHPVMDSTTLEALAPITDTAETVVTEILKTAIANLLAMERAKAAEEEERKRALEEEERRRAWEEELHFLRAQARRRVENARREAERERAFIAALEVGAHFYAEDFVEQEVFPLAIKAREAQWYQEREEARRRAQRSAALLIVRAVIAWKHRTERKLKETRAAADNFTAVVIHKALKPHRRKQNSYSALRRDLLAEIDAHGEAKVAARSRARRERKAKKESPNAAKEGPTRLRGMADWLKDL